MKEIERIRKSIPDAGAASEAMEELRESMVQIRATITVHNETLDELKQLRSDVFTALRTARGELSSARGAGNLTCLKVDLAVVAEILHPGNVSFLFAAQTVSDKHELQTELIGAQAALGAATKAAHWLHPRQHLLSFLRLFLSF